MDCKNFLEIVSEFENGELPEKLHEEAEKHMSGCPKCKDELKNFKKVISLCRDSMDAKLSLSRTLKMSSSISRLLSEGREPAFSPVLTMHDLSNYLRVSGDVIETYLNEIPCFELGGQILFRKEKVDEWIREREQKFGFELLNSQIRAELRENVFEETRKGGRIWQI